MSYGFWQSSRAAESVVRRWLTDRQLAAHDGWAKFQIKNVVLIYIVYFWFYGTGTGKYRAGNTGFPGQIPEGHMCLRSSDMAKMDPSAADMALAVWNGYVQDARRHARQWRPVDGTSHDSNDVGLVARAKTTAKAGHLINNINQIYQIFSSTILLILLIKFNRSLVVPCSLD